jgi:four helix bundle protein
MSEVPTQRSEAARRINSAKHLALYQIAYKLAMEVFELSQHFPPEERYGSTTQIRNSSRSVCLNLREASAKRRYDAHFLSKLTDSDAENSETNFFARLRSGL